MKNKADKAGFLKYLEEMIQEEAWPGSLAGWLALVPRLTQIADGDMRDRRLLKNFSSALEAGIRKQICLEIGPTCVFGLSFGRDEFGVDAETVMLDFEFSSAGNNHILTLVLKDQGDVGLFWGKMKKDGEKTERPWRRLALFWWSQILLMNTAA